ncbi:unnamed protein product [Calypogeia fissa]
MNGHEFSQKGLLHDGIDADATEEMEMLLSNISNAEAEVSDEVLEQVRRFLDKVSEVCGPSQEVKYQLLQRTFTCLQAWAQSPVLGKLIEIGMVRILATIYDKLIQTDYGRSEVLAAILELLFIVEDMCDNAEGKIHCGNLFLFRLMAFVTATSKMPSLKLQRAVIETICALVTKCPENQQAVLDQKLECYKLFKLFLPKCGDFQLQASITEIFYRLAKRGPQLLQFIQDKVVKQSIESLLQAQKPNLLLEIRKIVTLLNESLGRFRSVYSFLAERISINGHEMTTGDKWVNIGRAQLSFYISGLPDMGVDEASIMDVQYEDIMELKSEISFLVRSQTFSVERLRPHASVKFFYLEFDRGSSPTLLELLVRDRVGKSVFKSPNRLSNFLSDLSTIESSVLPKVRALSVGRGIEGKQASNSNFIDKSTSIGPVNLKTVYHTNMNRHPGNQVSLARDGRMPERNQPQVGRISSTIEGFNPLPGGRGQTVPHRQEDRPLQHSNMEPVDAYHNMSSGPPIDSQEDANNSRKVVTATDGNKTCENDWPSKPSHLMTRNLQAPPGPKTKSPSDTNVRARVCNSDSETEDHETDKNCGPVGELRMKKREDPRANDVCNSDSETEDHEADKGGRVGELRMKKREDPNNVVPPESLCHAAKRNSVRNTSNHVKDASVLAEVQRLMKSSGKNPMTPPRDMPASDSVMTDNREKPVTSEKCTKSGRRKSSRAVPTCATGQAENGGKVASRTLRNRQCKTGIRYFDADDEYTSGASESSTELVVTRQKKSRDMVTDPTIDKTAKQGAQTITKRRAAAQEETRALAICRRTDRTPDKHQCGRKTSTTSMSRKQTRDQNCSAERQANHERKVGCTSNPRNDDVEDVFRFTPNPIKEKQVRKTSLALSCKGRQISKYSEPCRKRRKKSAAESHNLLNIAPQRPCTSDRPRPFSVRPLAQITNLPPRASPAISPPAKEDTPAQQGPDIAGMSAFSRSSGTDQGSRSPVSQTRNTCSKSGRIVTRNSRLERWRSFSIRKLDLPKMDAASEDESIEGATQESSPLAKVLEEDDAQDNEGSSGIGMIAKLVRNFKHKVKQAEKKTVEDTLSNTMQRIDHEIRSAEDRIREEKTEFLDVCNKKCGQLDSQLQDQIKKILALYDKFKQDFAQHLERYDTINSKIEEADLELNTLAKDQAQEHKEVLAKLNDSCKNHLADADQKILLVGKSSTGMRGLKEALQVVLKDI